MSKVVSNKKQLRRLVELLQQNPNIGRGICSKIVAQKKWEEFALDLNSLGPPQREWHKWQRVWADLKCKIKKRKNENDFEAHAGGRNRVHHFTDMEEAVIKMLDLKSDTSFLYDKETQFEDSVMSANESLVSLEDMKFDPEDISTNIIKTDINNSAEFTEKTPSLKCCPSVNGHNRLFELDATNDNRNFHDDHQSFAQKQFFESMKDLMRDIKRSINNIEDHIKKGVQQEAELLELKREKLKLYKEKIKSERVDRKAKLKLNTQLLALKKQQQNGENNIKS